MRKGVIIIGIILSSVLPLFAAKELEVNYTITSESSDELDVRFTDANGSDRYSVPLKVNLDDFTADNDEAPLYITYKVKSKDKYNIGIGISGALVGDTGSLDWSIEILDENDNAQHTISSKNTSLLFIGDFVKHNGGATGDLWWKDPNETSGRNQIRIFTDPVYHGMHNEYTANIYVQISNAGV